MAALDFETGHQDQVHDIQWDYYGKRVATCSSDRTVKVFLVTEGENSHQAGTPLQPLSIHI